ncbi:response regulator [Deferribacter abyssi]|uniref:hybrid sensor histidine kinase/response regulator n=1 Tax=Deferribacter abyssi TaxID=213806 RepID=UPI003C1916C2
MKQWKKYKEIYKRLEEYELLNKVNTKILEKINNSSTFEDLFAGIFNTLIENNFIFGGSGYLYDNENKKLLLKYAKCSHNNYEINKEFDVDQFIGSFSINQKKHYTLYLKNINKNIIFLSGMSNIDSFFVNYFPILYKNEVIAVLECLSFEDLNKNIIMTLQGLIKHIGYAIQQLKYTEALLNMRNQLEEKNRILEAQYKELQAQSEELEAQSEELRVQKQELEEYSKKLKNAQKYKTEFIANMSHELRTPLNSIVGLSKLLLESKNIDNDVLEKLEIIHTSGKQLLNIINDILDMSKIESGKLEINIEKFKISEIINYVSKIIKPLCIEKNIDFQVNFEDSDLILKTDKHKIIQILLNILSNAVKYTDKGKIEMSVQTQDQNIVISVADTGQGIPEEFLPHIFEPFTTFRKKYSIQGTGLGLALTKKLVDLLEGKIEVKSIVGEGSIFTIYLPMKLSISKNELDQKDEFITMEFLDKNMETENSDNYNAKILVADDDVLVLSEIKKLLEEFPLNLKVFIATNGLDAKNIIEKESPNLILLDLDMPKMSGFEILDNLLVNNIKTNVIIITAMSLDKKRFLGYKNIVKGFFIKGKDNRQYLKELLNKFLNVPKTIKEPKQEKNDTPVDTKNIIEKETYNVLLVEDNFANRYLIKEILKDYNVIIDEAENGLEAMNKLRNKKYDIVLLDIQMPVMDGYETIEKIRSNFKDIYVIALTAKAFKDEVEHLKELGFDDFLIKPINIDLFISTIKKRFNLQKIN